MRLLPIFPSKFAVRPCQLLLRHRSRRCQARTIALQLCGVDWQQQPQLLYARLIALDPPAFRELRPAALNRLIRMEVRNGRYTAMVDINGANCLMQAKRCATAILPDYFPALNTVCQSGRRQGALIRTGRPGPQSPTSVNHGGALGNVTGRSPHDVLTVGRIAMFSDPASSINTPRNTYWRVG